MNEGWIKLHRKINENELITDTNASHVFLWLLVNVDRKTGKVKIGRHWLSRLLTIKESTLYKTLIRLEKKYKIVTLESNNHFTEISLINWSKYQSSNSDSNNQVTTKEQRSNTLQEVENKEVRNIISEPSYLLNVPDEDVIAFSGRYNATRSEVKQLGEKLKLWCETNNEKKKNYRSFLQGRLLAQFGYRSVAPVFTPNLPEISEAERQANLMRLTEMRAKLSKNYS